MKVENIVEGLVVSGIVAAVTWYIVNKNKTGTPFTLEELSTSRTAAALGLPNVIPDHLLANARGLGIKAGILRELGGTVSSAYRSPGVNAVVGGAKNSLHTLCRGLDVVGLTIAQIKNHPALASGLVEALDEGDHVHLGWSESELQK